MKTIAYVCLISLSLLRLGFCQEKIAKLPIDVRKFTITNFYAEKEYYVEFTEKDMDNTPSWNPENAPPPVSISQAIRQSKKFLRRYISSSDAWEIDSIKHTFLGQEKCFYTIDFYLDRSKAKNGQSATFTVVMKMDGSFFIPKVTSSAKH
ncbi:MAG: hypothetical protein HOP19_11240 [Acidobacteria bacterium]|nr:hypothetical protein [Acidobacteriota bacterium]